MHSALKGEVGLTAEMEQLLSAVVQHRVPQSWLVNSYPTATGLADWVQTLQVRVETLQQYVQVEGGPVTVNLAAFINPMGFLNAVLLQHCRQQFRDVQTFQYEVKVLEPSDLATTRPSSGIYLSGLHVHGALWDGKNGGLQQPPREHVTCGLPKVWMKIVDTSLRKSSQAKIPTYNCPLYISAPKNDILGAQNVVMHLELPTAADTGVLVQRRVFVTSAL
ncbi:dynein axonemal heavy chain 12-like [Branchiostoma lanceolatum]|uniref:dynein axonemal heavy chain 12-like n=1 Tax=Branchiostoma lanceolatum TaxID=7740 RepID=UPI003451DCCB